MKKIMKIIGIIILLIITVAIVVFGAYWYHNTHWYDKYDKALKKVGAKEKQVTLPNGNMINYGEVKNDKPALLLIHGQMSIWEDYALVMDELSKSWHIYAVDVYGHGESTHNKISHAPSVPRAQIKSQASRWFPFRRGSGQSAPVRRRHSF